MQKCIIYKNLNNVTYKNVSLVLRTREFYLQAVTERKGDGGGYYEAREHEYGLDGVFSSSY